VKEHRSKESKGSRYSLDRNSKLHGEISDFCEMSYLLRDNSHFIDMIMELRRRNNLIKKNQDIEGDKKYGYIRETYSRIIIFEGDEHSRILISESKDKFWNSL